MTDANEALQFRLIRDEEELKKYLDMGNEPETADLAFGPEMSHQIYGERYVGAQPQYTLPYKWYNYFPVF